MVRDFQNIDTNGLGADGPHCNGCGIESPCSPAASHNWSAAGGVIVLGS